MNTTQTDIQLQYLGFLNTPKLWNNASILGLQQIAVEKQLPVPFENNSRVNIRLGHRVEQFVFHELQLQKSIDILIKNLQIKDISRTLGELDCILTNKTVPIHLEIIYKFYLYDERIGTTELEHWIGPNRRDTLVEKLTKLKDKQLPLLYNEHTNPFLKALGLNVNTISQQVYFKAQLFTPLKNEIIRFENINKECVVGFYISYKDISQFSDCAFYIPAKIDWLMDIQLNIEWLNYQQYKQKLNELIQKKTAPLCWLKQPNGAMKKFFAVWWG